MVSPFVWDIVILGHGDQVELLQQSDDSGVSRSEISLVIPEVFLRLAWVYVKCPGECIAFSVCIGEYMTHIIHLFRIDITH